MECKLGLQTQAKLALRLSGLFHAHPLALSIPASSCKASQNFMTDSQAKETVKVFVLEQKAKAFTTKTRSF